jgi:hypothetical protein
MDVIIPIPNGIAFCVGIDIDIGIGIGSLFRKIKRENSEKRGLNSDFLTPKPSIELYNRPLLSKNSLPLTLKSRISKEESG